MSASPATRRAVAEIDFGDGANVSFKVGNRSIHQFWHLFSSHFRHVFLAPQRRADSGKVAWTWRESAEKRPVTATELVELRRRLSEASQSLAGGFGGLGRRDDDEASSLEGQVRASVGDMVEQLLAQRDATLAGFVCRTDAGLMMHSWGSAVAAQPYFPDAQPGEISGTVFVGADRPAGVTVVLENTQGIGGARVKTDREGIFRFPNVAPGSYHLRVVDRSDFPGGLTVEIEREPVSGLELRSTADEPLAMTGNITPLAEDVPWFRRGWTGLVLVVLILGAGTFAWWRSKRSSDLPMVAQTQSSSWQSAKGQLAANSPQTPANDDHKVGDEGAFSSLSSSVPPAKLPVTGPSGAAKAGNGRLVNGTMPPPGEPEPTARPEAGQKSSAPKTGDKPIGDRPSLAGHLPTRPDEKLAGDSTENKGSLETVDIGLPHGDEFKAPKNASAKPHASTLGKKLVPVPSALSSAADGKSEAGSVLPPADGAVAEAANSLIAPSERRDVRKPSVAKGSVPGLAPDASPAADATSENGDSDSAGASTGGISPDQSSSNSRKRPDSSVKQEAGKKSSSPSAPPEALATGVGAENESTDAGTSTGTSARTAIQRKKRADDKNQRPESGAEEAPSPEANSARTTNAPTGATAARRPKQNASDARNEAPASSPKGATADQATASDDSPETPSSSASAGQNSSDQRHRSAKNEKAATSTDGPEDEPVAEAAMPVTPVATGNSIGAIAPATNEGDELSFVGTVRFSPWKERLVQDLILPTRPLAADEEESVDDVRNKALQERIAQRPQSFRQPNGRSGLAFEFGLHGLGKNEISPRWKSDRDAKMPDSSATGTGAELAWGVAGPTRMGRFTLGYPDGPVLARVSIDESGAVTLKAASGVRVWCWFGVETKTGDGSSGAKEAGNIFDWRLLPEGPIPPSWKTHDRGLEGLGQRIDIPLDATTARVGNYEIALVDPATGWALTRSLSMQKP